MKFFPAVLALVIAGLPSPVHAQAIFGSIQGTVSYESGAVWLTDIALGNIG